MRKLRALIIFEDPFLREGVEDVLDYEAYQVRSLATAEHLGLIRDQFCPDVAIGWVYYQNTYRQIIDELVMRNIPTLFISTYPYTHHRKQYLHYPHQIDFLHAPFDAEEMMTIVNKMTEELRDDLHFLEEIVQDR